MPDEQAEPDDTATPSRSKAISAVSAVSPGTAKSVVLGSRGAAAPKITASGRRRLRPASSSSRKRAMRRGVGRIGRSAGRAAAPNPAMAATFSVPARSAALLAAAADQRRRQCECRRARTSAPAPCGPPILCADERQRSAPSASMSAGDAARRLHRVDMQQCRRRHARCRRPRATGWITPVSLLASITETSGRSARASALPARQDRARRRAVTGKILDRVGGETTAAQHRGVLDGRHKKPVAPVLCARRLERRRQRQHVGFGRAGGEGDVLGLRADQAPRLFARLLNDMARGAALGVDRGGVAGEPPAPRPCAARASARSGAVAFQSK